MSTSKWQLVPMEPTGNMLHAYATAWQKYQIAGLTLGQRGAHEWRMMLRAAPDMREDSRSLLKAMEKVCPHEGGDARLHWLQGARWVFENLLEIQEPTP